jgi:hypothetical protein
MVRIVFTEIRKNPELALTAIGMSFIGAVIQCGAARPRARIRSRTRLPDPLLTARSGSRRSIHRRLQGAHRPRAPLRSNREISARVVYANDLFRIRVRRRRADPYTSRSEGPRGGRRPDHCTSTRSLETQGRRHQREVMTARRSIRVRDNYSHGNPVWKDGLRRDGAQDRRPADLQIPPALARARRRNREGRRQFQRRVPGKLAHDRRRVRAEARRARSRQDRARAERRR